jgi:hypothetical protein
MRRLHLFEWEDQPWLPRVFRDFITDQLKYTHGQAMRRPVNRAIAEQLAEVLARTGSTRIVDLCAGAGGPITKIGGILIDDLQVPVELVVTDLFPNVEAFRALEAESNGRIKARYESTNATDVPAELPGLRTVFTALHHFKPELVQRVLADAVRKNAPIAVFEPLERKLSMTVLVGVMSFLRGLTHAHIAGRLTPTRALFSYLLPVAPAMFAWDGAVSTLRTYTADELLALAHGVTTDKFEWKSGRFDIDGPFGKMPTTYLIGVPK